MYVGSWRIGVQCHDVAVLQGEFFTSKILHRHENLLGWRTGRHREDCLVHEPRWFFSVSDGQVRLTAMLVQLKVPVLDQSLVDARALQPLPVISFKINVSSPSNVLEMLFNG